MTPHLLRCQEFAVAYYGFTLGRLGSGASSTFHQLGFEIFEKHVFKKNQISLGILAILYEYNFSNQYIGSIQ
jgi:hypothetical protein